MIAASHMDVDSERLWSYQVPWRREHIQIATAESYLFVLISCLKDVRALGCYTMMRRLIVTFHIDA